MSARKALDNLADALVEDILNMSDEEILAEFQEDHGDVERHIAEMRAIAEKSIAIANARLQERSQAMTSFLPEQQKPVQPATPPIVPGSNVRAIAPTDEALADAPGVVQAIGTDTADVSWKVEGKMLPARRHRKSELVNVD